MKISIIIPVYNTEDCVERCVRSCLAQTCKDIEIIAVDDGSTDSSLSILEKMASGDSRIKVLHQENAGSSAARNAGIRMATGDFLGFVDADDYIEPDMYEKLSAMIREEKVDVAQVCRDEVAPDGSSLPMVVTVPDGPVRVSSEDFLKELLLHRGDCSFCTKLINRSLFDIALFPAGELNEDFRLFTTFLREIDSVGILPDICYHVYYREGSNTRTSKSEFSRVFKDIVVNADRMERMIERDYPDLKEYAVRFALVQRLDYMLHIPVGMMKSRDEFYHSVKAYLRAHRDDIRNNPYLTDDQRHKLGLLAAAPRTVRSVHALSMKLRGIH
ncbi:Glycosyltransferase involved in cell wall bisynthesis [Lachnospiraceae bacterium XBB2008]|nr:Glycosyltransferase involved in cell wall bisynthesis [Lachnospiraceae bacterium XBB2008]